MRMRVGILGDGTGWELLLRQVGVPFAMVDESAPIDGFSAVVAGGRLSMEEMNRLRSYLRAGGGVLCSAELFSKLSSIPVRKCFIRFMLPGSEFAGIGLVDIFSPCMILEKEHGHSDAGDVGPIEREFGGGYVVVLPFDAGRLGLDRRQVVKSFYARSRRLPFERVSTVSRGGVRKLVSRALEVLHHRRGIPFIHLWYYPGEARSVFCFRIDTDYGTNKEIEDLYNLSCSHDIPFTWFLDVKSQRQHLQRYAEMRGQEIGVHCFEHKRYSSTEDAIHDIGRAIDILKGASIDARTFAAPYGQWSDAIRSAVEHFGFDYSSEFCHDYDNLPSETPSTSHIPIHPISVGSLRRQGFDSGMMEEYFTGLANRNVLRREPVNLYHHPKNGHRDVLNTVLSVVRQLQIPPMRMIDYGRWWKVRDAHSLGIDIDQGKCTVRTPMNTTTHWLHMSRENRTEAFTPLAGELALEGLPWKPIPAILPPPEDIRRIRKFNPWIPLQRAEDFFMKPFTHKM